MKKILLILCLPISFVNLFAQDSTKVDYGNNSEVGQYYEVNNIKLYYEIYGKGDPLVLLHGSMGSISGHSQRIEHYKNNYQVIAIDSRAHGKSSDNEDSLTYELMSNDIAKLLNHLQVDSTYIWGQSDGGILGLMLAMNYPKLVKRVAAFGANARPDTTAVIEEIVNGVDQTIKDTTTSARKRKLFKLLYNHPHISVNELQKIEAPVLLMYGDRDLIRLEHALELFYNIPNSNLFIMPGTTHYGAYEKFSLFIEALDSFFEDPFSNRSTLDKLLN